MMMFSPLSTFFRKIHSLDRLDRALLKASLILTLGLAMIWGASSWAYGVVGVGEGDVDLGDIPTEGSIISSNTVGGDFLTSLKTVAVQLIYYAKVLLNGFALFVFLWIGTVWITSLGDDGKRTEGKWKLIFVVIALALINIPEAIYRVLTGSDSYLSGEIRRVNGKTIITTDPGGQFTESDFSSCDNFFFCPYGIFNNVYIRGFFYGLEVIMVVVAVVFLTYGAIKLMVSGGNEEAAKSARYRFIYGGIALLIIGFVEALYKAVFIGGLVESDLDVFVGIINMFLFFVGPVAIVFLIVGAYYYITSGGSQERADRGKRILIWTFFATIFLLLSYTIIVEIVAGVNL